MHLCHLTCHNFQAFLLLLDSFGHNIHIREHVAYTFFSKVNPSLVCSNSLLTYHSFSTVSHNALSDSQPTAIIACLLSHLYVLFPTILYRIANNPLGHFKVSLYSCTAPKCSKNIAESPHMAVAGQLGISPLTVGFPLQTMGFPLAEPIYPYLLSVSCLAHQLLEDRGGTIKYPPN